MLFFICTYSIRAYTRSVTAADAKITALVGLDISAAFDTIDHDVLANRLKSQFGVVGAASSWLRSYLRGRQQFVRLGRHSSPMTQCDCGVPQVQCSVRCCSLPTYQLLAS